MRSPAGRSPRRYTSRRRRLARDLWTAPPIFRLATTPRREGALPSTPVGRIATRYGETPRAPEAITARNSEDREIRWSRDKAPLRRASAAAGRPLMTTSPAAVVAGARSDTPAARTERPTGGSGRQPSTAPATPAGDDRAAAGSAHPRPETVLPLPPPPIGLKRPFHGIVLSKSLNLNENSVVVAAAAAPLHRARQYTANARFT